MTSINPYLNFNGNCEQAFEFYKSVFGGEFLTKSRFKDGPPPPSGKLSSEVEQQILHVALPIGKNVLMGSDCPPWAGHPVTIGTNFAISVSTESKEETDKLFNGLSQGGRAIMPLQDMFWGAYFGMLTDKFGIAWMVSYDQSQKEAKAKTPAHKSRIKDLSK